MKKALNDKRGGWNKGIPTPQRVKDKISQSLMGKSPTEETRIKLSKSHMGKKLSVETKIKLSLARKKFIKNGGVTVKGFLGKKHTEETKKKLSKYWSNRKRPYCSKENHWNWQGGISTSNKQEKSRLKHKRRRLRLRFEIFIRDKFTCQYCNRGGEGIVLEIDHRFPNSKGGAMTKTNLITACKDCNLGKGDLVLNEFLD